MLRPERVPLHARDGHVRAYALVDAEDAERIHTLRWSLMTIGYVHAALPRRGRKRIYVYMHRFVAGCERGDGREVDHKNGDRLDNRRCNLRITTRAQNAQNLVHGRRGGASHHRGVSYVASRGSSKKWAAQVKVAGRNVFHEFFVTEREAAVAAASARERFMTHA